MGVFLLIQQGMADLILLPKTAIRPEGFVFLGHNHLTARANLRKGVKNRVEIRA